MDRPRRLVLAVTIAALWTTGACAQSIGIYVDPPGYGYYDDDSYIAEDYFAPSYGYSRGAIIESPARHCGTYPYWNGSICVDARGR
jgi:hypothetical protein